MELHKIASQIAQGSRLSQDQARKWVHAFTELVHEHDPCHRIRTRRHPRWTANDPSSGSTIRVMQKQHLHIKLRKS
ncbi:hypothetical protein [Halomonas huangheensis]|uniref:Uncharacterized protein n=1 Tax=Halomonas huangheensis TaxID=1178482 RepID=W1N752_9GAMM|nr:hypothetical protein [Halomonas huangheensis]ALM54220.1 hypothetical protein AR456_19575 [Halomonas huangheensis]ERL50765.1 hypothetical protein BJB45_19405 [Halomonas huangheensis]